MFYRQITEDPQRYRHGSSDQPAGEQPPDRSIALLATAVPRPISLAVAGGSLRVAPAVVGGERWRFAGTSLWLASSGAVCYCARKARTRRLATGSRRSGDGEAVLAHRDRTYVCILVKGAKPAPADSVGP
jgi:hypothetical protein